MYLDRARKPEHPEETLTGTGRRCNLYTERSTQGSNPEPSSSYMPCQVKAPAAKVLIVVSLPEMLNLYIRWIVESPGCLRHQKTAWFDGLEVWILEMLKSQTVFQNLSSVYRWSVPFSPSLLLLKPLIFSVQNFRSVSIIYESLHSSLWCDVRIISICLSFGV